ncbi:hypothetical protein ACWEF9_18190 [Streptomyces sp. NPDC004980]
MWVYTSTNTNDVCVANWSEVTSGGADNGGSTESWSMTWWYSNCQQHIPANSNAVRVRTDILAYDMEQGVWWVCWPSPYKYNSAPDYEVGLAYNINRACGGDRWYANNTLAEAKDVRGTWRGGWLASGNEWVAGTGLSAAKAVPEPTLTAGEALARGEVRAGSPAGPTLNAEYFRTGTPLPVTELHALETLPTERAVPDAPQG